MLVFEGPVDCVFSKLCTGEKFWFLSNTLLIFGPLFVLYNLSST